MRRRNDRKRKLILANISSDPILLCFSTLNFICYSIILGLSRHEHLLQSSIQTIKCHYTLSNRFEKKNFIKFSQKFCTSHLSPIVNKLISFKVDFRPGTDPNYGSIMYWKVAREQKRLWSLVFALFQRPFSTLLTHSC
jgi:hypothetical protein